MTHVYISDAPISFLNELSGETQTIPRSQCAQLLQYFSENRNKPLRFQDILSATGIQQVNARISDLRNKWDVTIFMERLRKSNGKGQYGQYLLADTIVIVETGNDNAG